MDGIMHAVVRALFLSLILLLPVTASGPPVPVILDTDIGDDIDDALALALALQSPELDVRAVVTVLQHRQRRADLVWKILELYGRTDIPVGLGADQPLLTKPRTDSVRQAAALGPADRMPASKRHNGILLAIETCMNSPGKITWVAYGPLTNLAVTLKAEPRITRKVERFVLMNGVYFREGKVEYNTGRDPEAAQIVFNSGVPITAVGLDVTMKCRLSPEDMKKIENSNRPTVKFLRELIHIWQNGRPDALPILHDPLAVAVTFHPGFIRTVTGHVTVDTKGMTDLTYGRTIFQPDPSGTTQVATEVDARAFINFFLERLLRRPRPVVQIP